MKKTIKEQWEEYKDNVLPTPCSEIQESECRQAFYAGAISTFALVLNINDLEEEEAMAVLDQLNTEFNEYLDTIS